MLFAAPLVSAFVVCESVFDKSMFAGFDKASVIAVFLYVKASVAETSLLDISLPAKFLFSLNELLLPEIRKNYTKRAIARLELKSLLESLNS